MGVVLWGAGCVQVTAFLCVALVGVPLCPAVCVNVGLGVSVYGYSRRGRQVDLQCVRSVWA